MYTNYSIKCSRKHSLTSFNLILAEHLKMERHGKSITLYKVEKIIPSLNETSLRAIVTMLFVHFPYNTDIMDHFYDE